MWDDRIGVYRDRNNRADYREQEFAMELTGKRIIITGAARGLGKYMAMACVRAGAQVLFTATDRRALEETVEESKAEKDQAVIHIADVRYTEQVDSIAAAAQRAFGGADVLFNNAGVGTSAIREDFWENPIRFWTVSESDYRRFLEINTLSALRLASLVAPEMIGRGWGRIVNVTTSLSTMLLAGQAAYSISKAGLEAVTSVMAGDLAGTGVTANVLAPGGPADTRMVVGVNVPRESLIPADCMAAPAVWLASNASDGVTGKRFLGIKWDRTLPPAEAAIAAGAPVAWTGYGDQMRAPTGGMPPQKSL
jgi:NAD(P)-dependent dehydrogenase (short-subunit alcohol dehydrogenase family)